MHQGIYARSVPTKLADGTVRWEGFLIEVEPAVNGKSATQVNEPEILTTTKDYPNEEANEP